MTIIAGAFQDSLHFAGNIKLFRDIIGIDFVCMQPIRSDELDDDDNYEEGEDKIF